MSPFQHSNDTPSMKTLFALTFLLALHVGTLSAQNQAAKLDEFLTAVQPFYEALKSKDWQTVASHCALTADTKPPKFFYIPDALDLNDQMKWEFLKRFTVSYSSSSQTDSPPEVAYLVLSRYSESNDKVSRDTEALKPQMRLDVWLRVKDNWRVVPEQDALQERAMKFSGSTTPLGEKEFSGAIFDSQTALEEKVFADSSRRQRSEKRDKDMKLKHEAIMSQLNEILAQNPGLSSDQIKQRSQEIMHDQLEPIRKELDKEMALSVEEMRKNIQRALDSRKKTTDQK